MGSNYTMGSSETAGGFKTMENYSDETSDLYEDFLKHEWIPDSTISSLESFDQNHSSYTSTSYQESFSNSVPHEYSSSTNDYSQNKMLDSAEQDYCVPDSTMFYDNSNIESLDYDCSTDSTIQNLSYTVSDYLNTLTVFTPNQATTVLQERLPDHGYDHFASQDLHLAPGQGYDLIPGQELDLIPCQELDPEHEKVMERRKRNKIAATKCRNKKKEKTNQLILQAKIEEEKNIQLRNIVARLQEEKNLLVKMLMEDRLQNSSQIGHTRQILEQDLFGGVKAEFEEEHFKEIFHV